MTQATTEQRKGGLGLTQKIFIGLALGIVLGAYINNVNPAWAEYVRPFSQLFLRLIKMIIAPLIFATLVAGTAWRQRKLPPPWPTSNLTPRSRAFFR